MPYGITHKVVSLLFVNRFVLRVNFFVQPLFSARLRRSRVPLFSPVLSFFLFLPRRCRAIVFARIILP